MADKRLTHGLSRTKAYSVWSKMMYRCFNKNSNRYKNYAERGISVCDNWMNFEAFYADVGDIPDHLSLERIDVNKGYSTDNCTLIEKRKQAWNRTDTVYVDADGCKVSIAELSDSTGIGLSTLKYRLRNGFDYADLISDRHALSDIVEVNGEKITLREASEKYGVKLNTIRTRYRRGDRGCRLVRSS